MVATQGNSEGSSFDDKNSNIANLCLVAQEDEVQSEQIVDFIFDELQDVFHELLDEFKKVSLKNRNLKLKNQSLLNGKEEISQNNKALVEENNSLKKELDNLRPLIEKFTYGSKKLHMILNN